MLALRRSDDKERWDQVLSIRVSTRSAFVLQVHLQEVGGKKKDMAMLETVGTELQAMAPATDFWFSGMIVQCDTKAPTFTALANAYFVRRTCLDAVQVFISPVH